MNRLRSVLVLMLGCSGLFGPRGSAAEPAAATADDVARLAAALPGDDQAALAAAADRLATLAADGFRPPLAALGSATPAGANWLRSGLDRAADRLGDALGGDTLAGFVADKGLAPRGRSLAFGWLEARDPTRAAALLAGMLDEEALDLRRAAVAKLLADVAAEDAAAQHAAHRRALGAARDVDQVEAIATWLTEHGEPTDVAEALGFVRRWRVSGEYDNAGGAGFAKAYPPEEGGAVPAAVDWKPVASTHNHGEIDLNATVATKKGVLAYALAEVEMPTVGKAEIRIGSPCAVVVWVNGRQVMAHEIYHASEAIDQYVAPAELRQGANTVLVKCCQNEQTEPWAGEWKFQLRVTDPLGRPLATQREEEPK
ncbi:MAG: hypothetical protein ACKO1M_04895 [Planctomycetota bacterium]